MLSSQSPHSELGVSLSPLSPLISAGGRGQINVLSDLCYPVPCLTRPTSVFTMVWVPAYFNAPLDLEDRAMVAELRQKVIPWTKTPFDPVQNDPTFDEKTLPGVPREEEAEELDKVEHVPQWLELFFDLAWTVTFSGLSGNTHIKGGTTVLSFITFFILAWWLWTAQVIYDTKYYVNDALHRFVLLIQFLLFGALAAFTSGFDISIGFKEPEDDAGEQAQAEYVKRSFMAISIIFCMTRVTLALQYIRVIRLSKHRRLTSLYMTLGSILVSAALFLGAFFVVRANPDGRLQNALKIGMWGLGVGVEVLAYCMSTTPRGLLTEGNMPARLQGLTTIIIGEGLNGFIEPVTAAVKSVGFNAHVAGQLIIAGLIIFLIFIIYFQSFRARLVPSEARQKFVIFSHLPIQLAIILLLEGLKSVLIILTLDNSSSAFQDLMFHDPTGYDPSNALVVDAFRKVGVDIVAVNKIMDDNLGMVTSGVFDFDAPEVAEWNFYTLDNFREQERVFRNLAVGLRSLYKSFDAIEGPLEDELTDYIDGFQLNNQAVNDTAYVFTWQIADGGPYANFPDDLPGLFQVIDTAALERLAPASWIAPISGALLIALALIMLANGISRNHYAWWSMCARVLVGVSLCLLGTLNVSDKALWIWTDDWLLPTIIIAYAVLYLVDYVIAVFHARALASLKKQYEGAEVHADGIPPIADLGSSSSASSWKEPQASRRHSPISSAI
ncbi:bacterial low temperature requirement A protein-domain-containing protein [Auriculariales sp. MPI-PUGE-AT-0066]|nr:bacterial low temperature requirement A protein-domain-containing protein [Auriculariales sp. MPI-PUGE-AT-0066]